MVTPLLSKHGSPIFNPDGTFQTVTGVEEIKQRVHNAFLTQKGSDIFVPEYGFESNSTTHVLYRTRRSP